MTDTAEQQIIITLIAAVYEVVQLASVPVHVGDEWLVVVPSRAIARLTAALAFAEEAQP